MLRWIHLIFGLGLAGVFAVTGHYMRVDFPDKDAIDQMLRVLMRSRHIYILFISLMHILLGVYLSMSSHWLYRSFQYLGSLLLFVAAGVLLWAWYAETYLFNEFSEISRWGIYLSLAGVFTHLIGGSAASLAKTRAR